MKTRYVFAGFLLIPLVLLAEGLVLQHLKGQAPCPLCVIQRAGFVLVGLIALVALLRQPRERGAAAGGGESFSRAEVMLSHCLQATGWPSIE